MVRVDSSCASCIVVPMNNRTTYRIFPIAFRGSDPEGEGLRPSRFLIRKPFTSDTVTVDSLQAALILIANTECVEEDSIALQARHRSGLEFATEDVPAMWVVDDLHTTCSSEDCTEYATIGSGDCFDHTTALEQ